MKPLTPRISTRVRRCGPDAAPQARALDQAQLGGQLRAGQVQAALAALAEAQHQRVLAAGDPQRVAGQYAARLATVVAGDHLGAQTISFCSPTWQKAPG